MPEIVGRLRTPRLATAPSSPANGEMYFDTVANILYYWNGTAWVSGGGSGQAEAWYSGTGAPAGGLGAVGDWYLDTTAGPSWPQLVSSLPGSPTDGQECYYQADATNGVIWHLRYRAASASAYKWEFIGGSDLVHQIDTSEATGVANTWTNLATNGPLITVPLAGDYDTECVARGLADASTQHCYTGVALGDVTPAAQAIQYINASGYAMLAQIRRFAGVSASQILKMRYYANTTGLQFAARALNVRPVRVG